MYKPKNQHERILHRLKIAQGHLKKVTGMVENNEYCISILQQSTAVQKSLREIDNLIMENHLKTCASDAIKDGDSEKAIAEVMNVFRNTHK